MQRGNKRKRRRKLGRITDLIFSNETGKIRGIVTPYVKRTFFGKGQEVFIPWRCVKKLGEDVIIVDISGVNERGRESAPPPDDLPPMPQQIKTFPGCRIATASAKSVCSSIASTVGRNKSVKSTGIRRGQA